MLFALPCQLHNVKNYIQFNYYLIFATEAKHDLTYPEAQEYCNNLRENAYLAELPDEETRLLIDSLASEQVDDQWSWWIGGTDVEKVSHIFWFGFLSLFDSSCLL